MQELKPCPFCEKIEHLSAVRIGSAVSSFAPYAIRCRNVDCEDVQGPTGDGQFDAIRKWNARAPLASPTSTPVADQRAKDISNHAAHNLLAAVKLAVDLVDRDVIRVRPSDRERLTDALVMWWAAINKAEGRVDA
jgi:hypothetical protein